MESSETFSGTHPDSAANSASHQSTALNQITPEDVRSAAEDLASSAEQLYRVGDAFLGRQAQDRPYVVLGAAAGIGFILGGGLAWRMAGALVNVAGRMAVTNAVESWLQSSASRAP